MQADNTTLYDLGIYANNPGASVFDKLDGAITLTGSLKLKKFLTTPLPDLKAILDIQETLKYISERLSLRPKDISNGSIQVIERFFETPIDPLPVRANALNTRIYKLLHGPDYSHALYAATHCLNFLQGLWKLVKTNESEHTPGPLKKTIDNIKAIVCGKGLDMYLDENLSLIAGPIQKLGFIRIFRHTMKGRLDSLIDLFSTLDAWYGMAASIEKHNLVFPEFVPTDEPYLEAKGLYHLSVPKPVSYDLHLDARRHFLFLTGANMAGKSTFIKAAGTAVFLAHTGMAVPAQQMKTAYFDGIISNINIADDISKGESYFFNEVKRIKETIIRINDNKKWLILIDELFKGTNLQDAMKCSTAIIEGLLHKRSSLFILSSHLYEIGESLMRHPEIVFCYFETAAVNGQLTFTYSLKPGISKDRIGYLILENEGVLKLLQ